MSYLSQLEEDSKTVEQLKKDAAIHRFVMNGQIKLNRKAWAVVEYLRGVAISARRDDKKFPAELEKQIQFIMAQPDVEKDYDPK
jgi:hypothetical protein